MKFTRSLIALSTLLACTASFAGTISGASNITFLAFDGQKVKKSTKLDIQEGKPHQVVVEVAGLYRSGGDDTFFESSPIVLTFNGSSENIVLKTPKLNDAQSVAQFQKNPTFILETASGKAVSFKQDILKGEGFLPNSNITETLSAYNAAGNTASVKAFSTTAIPAALAASGKASKGKVMVQGENIAEQQLQYWFQQADKETQKRFLDWAKKQ